MDIIFFRENEKLSDSFRLFSELVGAPAAETQLYLSAQKYPSLLLFQVENTQQHPHCICRDSHFLPPVLLGLGQERPLLNSRCPLPWVKTPCFMRKPCLSFPLLLWTTQPSGLCPEYLSAGTSVALLLTERVAFVVVVHFSELLTARG